MNLGVRRIAVGLLGAIALTMLAAVPFGAASSAATSHPGVDTNTLPSLGVAQREATDLGPVSPTTVVNFSLALVGRNQAALSSLLSSGGHVSPAQWNATYGPDPAAVASIERALRAAGLSPSWQPGNALLTVHGRAVLAERFLHVSVHEFLFDGSIHFYAPLTQPAPPRAFTHTVEAVTGLNNYRAHPIAAIAGPNGVTPEQMVNFYDLTPLRAFGIDGAGVTVMFPEWAMPDASVLSAFAQKFGLPPFDVTVHTDPSAWGQPDTSTSGAAGEAALDLELVHGLAPAAKEVVYEAGDGTELAAMLQTMVSQNPHAVLSSSISSGACELDQGVKQLVTAQNAVFQQAAAVGVSVFWAAGDRGAYSCIADGDASTAGSLSVLPGADSPFVTAVGGTVALLASNGAYYKEAAWGEPLETWGGGGGVSTFFSQPSYQVAPGLAANSLGGRGMPDVAANADIVSGWDVFSPSQQGAQEGPVGGTSAATPCWAAITALIDEDLDQQGLPHVGFANPALYLFANSPAGMPVYPFHSVTEGSNLHFVATAGWNPATGLGTPDASHLADDFEWYERSVK
jgi:kumamolisin